MKTRSKVLSVLLTVMLVIGLAPMSVPAEDMDALSDAGDAVNITDPEFQKLINSSLKNPEDTPITAGDMAKLSSLTISGTSGVKDIEGIQYAVNLRYLTMSGDIQSVDQIAGLEKLINLAIESNDFLTHLSQLGSKPELTRLDVDGCANLTSLNGLTAENYPKLEELSSVRCYALSDISALSGREIPMLKQADFGDCTAITDIAPLNGYDAMEELDLEKIKITEANREDYKKVISSMINLNTLYMPYCDITDEDTEIFSTLKNLKKMVLNYNNLTSTEFCDQLPANMEVLGLLGNSIDNMDNLERLTQLTILNLGSNKVTDFSFISKLTSLTAGFVRHEEGTSRFPVRETYSYGSQSNPIEIENGQLVLDNPYIGVDGKPISFENATIASTGDNGVTISYNKDENKITLGNIPSSTTVNSIMIKVPYDIPVSNSEHKVSELRIETYVREKVLYRISYNWGTDAPAGQILPSDNTEYQDLDAAMAAVDQTFTSQTTVKGEKNGKEGTWTFSGWTVTVSGATVNATGSWSFTENHQHSWGAPTYTWSEDGKTCTAERVCTGDSSHVDREVVEAVGKVTTPATCTAKGWTTYTAAFTNDWTETQTKVLEDVEMIPHSYGSEWKSNENSHWHVCDVCKTKADEDGHTFKWIVDQEATDAQAGSRHQECTVCGYALAAVEIPPTANPGDTEQPVPPQTADTSADSSKPVSPRAGDSRDPLPWVVLCVVAAAGLGAVLCVKKKKKNL